MAVVTYTSNKGNTYKIDDADEIHRGGEGRIMILKETNKYVAKLYHPGILAIDEAQYIYLVKLDKNLFVVPHELLTDKKGNICGFTMEYIGKDFFPISVIFSKNFCTTNNITEAVKQTIAEKLITAVSYAHSVSVVIGDLNQYNILVNNKAEIKLIDTDSYESPNHKHTGILLDEIRDYMHAGKVSQESDYFALSIMIFYSFTYTHPFKGIHKQYKKISDRMIYKLPIFINSPDIIVPKVYQPVQDKKIMQQFEHFYLEGKRYLISLKGASQITSPATVKLTKITANELTITTIVENLNILDIYFKQDKGLVETVDNFIVFDTKNKSYTTKIFTISKKLFDKIYIGNNNILVQKGELLYHYISETSIILLTNISVPEKGFVSQFEDILLIIDQDVMYTVYLNDITNNSIRNKRTEVLGKSFTYFTGLVQNTGGIRRIFYNSGLDITNIKFDKSIKEIKQSNNVGIIQHVENNKVTNNYFKISGMKSEIYDTNLERVYDFAFMPTDKGEGIIFEPSDNAIKAIRTQDFNTVSIMECDIISENTKLQYCKSGIIAWEEKSVYLLNKK